MRDFVVVFGAGVRPDGSPSGTLRHRIDGAVAWAQRQPKAKVMPTGGVGAHSPAEAVVIRRALLAAGIKPSRIVLEPIRRNTLESVSRCDAMLRERGDYDPDLRRHRPDQDAAEAGERGGEEEPAIRWRR